MTQVPVSDWAAVSRDGTVEAGTALYSVGVARATVVRVDNERGRIGGSADGVDYEFRLPRE